MRIGIDIDNTITDIEDELMESAFNYAKSLNKEINYDYLNSDDKNNDGGIYQKIFNFTYEELKYFLKDIQEEIVNKAVPRKNAINYINKLKEKENEIYIITARDSEFHDDPYKLSKDWLDKNNIKYDKLIVNAREKASICKKENIDIFIDDNINNCIDIANLGIKTIRISEDETNYNNIVNVKTWDEIYNYIIDWSNK